MYLLNSLDFERMTCGVVCVFIRTVIEHVVDASAICQYPEGYPCSSEDDRYSPSIIRVFKGHSLSRTVQINTVEYTTDMNLLLMKVQVQMYTRSHTELIVNYDCNAWRAGRSAHRLPQHLLF